MNHRRAIQKKSLLFGLHIFFYCAIALYLSHEVTTENLFIGLLLIWVSLTDIEKFEIPDIATLLLWIIAVSLEYQKHDFSVAFAFALLSGVVWFLLFWGVAKLFEFRHGQEGLGFGDIKLMLPIGTLCGAEQTIYVVLCASVSGAILMFFHLAIRKKQNSSAPTGIAFGPFLAFFAWAIFLKTTIDN